MSGLVNPPSPDAPSGAAGGDLTGSYPNPTIKTNPTLSGVTIANGTDVTISATTGTKIGQSTSKIGVFGVTPTTRPAALTQTYSTATRTHANPAAAAVDATASTQTTPFGYATQAQADAIVTAVNALVTDLANVKQVLNAVIDDLQALGLEQ